MLAWHDACTICKDQLKLNTGKQCKIRTSDLATVAACGARGGRPPAGVTTDCAEVRLVYAAHGVRVTGAVKLPLAPLPASITEWREMAFLRVSWMTLTGAKWATSSCS